MHHTCPSEPVLTQYNVFQISIFFLKEYNPIVYMNHIYIMYPSVDRHLWPTFLFFAALSGFAISIIMALLKESGNVPSAVLWNGLRNIGVCNSLKI